MARGAGLGAILVLAMTSGGRAAPPRASEAPVAAPARLRWTATTPDAAIAVARARALSPGALENDVIAAALTIPPLADRATYGLAQRALEEIARAAPGLSVEARGDVALLARTLAPDATLGAGALLDRQLGVITDLALLGPFRDTGGGLATHDGPEARGASFSEMQRRYDWGAILASWRAIPPGYATAGGIPLDLFVHPRTESCAWIATKITVPTAQPIVVRLGATGQARLMFDGALLGSSEDVNASMKLDRLAARVEATAGPHLVAAKICKGALADDGRARLRLTDVTGAPLVLSASADLAGSEPPPSAARPRAAPRVQKLATPLARTLEARAGGEALLDAAIARTLGGADDLKSPRAHGILSTIASSAQTTPDALAMAASIAPSGSHRSGWLNLARKRAEAAGDAETIAFVDRRLVGHHLGAQLVDWAMASLRAAKLDRASDGEAVMLGALVDESMGVEALRLKAHHALAAAVAAAPATVPSGIVRELASTSRSFDRAGERDARARLTSRGEPSAWWVEAEATRGKKAVAEAAARTFEGGLDDADEGIATALSVSRAGAHEEARALFATLVRWAPNRAEAWAGLATEMAALGAGDAEAPAAVNAALSRARALAPGEARYRAELALRQRPGSQAEARDDERYLVPSQAVLARRQGVPAGTAAPEVSERQTYFLRAVVMHPDKRVSQLIHYAREIVIAPRTQDELVEDIPADGDLTEILRARVHRKSGGVAFPTEEHNEGTHPKIRWPELMPGDTVEVAVRTWTSSPVGGRGDPPFHFLDFAGSVTTKPSLYDEVIVEAPPDAIFVDVINGAPDRREDKDEKGRHITRLIWDKPMSVPDEPLSPPLTELIPVVVGSTFKDWAAFRSWYAEAVSGFTEPDDEVRRLAAELTRGKTTREEKLAALFNFVADNIRYVNYTSGEAWLPNRPQELLAKREGDCDDKAMLLITLLKVIGIDAQEVMVQTRQTGQPGLLRAKGAAIPYFDHGIAFLPGPNGGTYLDATSPQSRLGPLPSMDSRAVALRMDSGPAEIVRLPAAAPEDHGADIQWTLTLNASGSAELAGEERLSGDGAFWLRTNLSEAGARAQFVEDHLSGGWLPTVAVDPKGIEFKGDLAGGKAWMRYRAKSDGFARHEQNDLVVPLSSSSTLASQLAPLVRRTLPVWLPPGTAPTHESRTVKVVAPRGYRFAPLPPGGDENGGEFGRAHLEIAKDREDARAIVIKQSVVMNESVIPVAKYAEWRAWLQRVDSLLHKSVRLVGDETTATRGGR